MSALDEIFVYLFAALGFGSLFLWVYLLGVRAGARKARERIMVAVRKELGGDAWRKIHERLSDAGNT